MKPLQLGGFFIIATSEPSRKEGWTGGGAHQWRLSQSRSLRGGFSIWRTTVTRSRCSARTAYLWVDNASKADDERLVGSIARFQHEQGTLPPGTITRIKRVR